MDLHIDELTNTLKSVRSAGPQGAPQRTAAEGAVPAYCLCANRAGAAPAPEDRLPAPGRVRGGALAHFAALGR
ncbi:MAG TPA: hypothetical protein VKY74_05805 [Chloroflexia bacterium]|nr:hypothetical protein [Chloroflexia bacterium]